MEMPEKNNTEQGPDNLDELLLRKVGDRREEPVGRRVADFSDLDDLLKESVALRDDAIATKNLREKLKKGKMSSDERQEIEAKVREWEARHVWDTVANVAVFEETTCECGYYSTVFSHLMHRQKHKELAGKALRMVRADAMAPGVPQLVAKQYSEVVICAECAASKGWDLDSEEIIEWQA